MSTRFSSNAGGRRVCGLPEISGLAASLRVIGQHDADEARLCGELKEADDAGATGATGATGQTGAAGAAGQSGASGATG